MISHLLLPLAPLLTVVALILAGRGPVVGALGGLLMALAVSPALGLHLSIDLVPVVVSTTAVLTLSVALVILPGQYLNGVLRARGVLAGLAELVGRLPLARERKALLLLFSVAPALESLTGFGVSLFLTVPILLRLYPAETACRLALIGMSSASWGAMALALLLGARLAGVDPTALGAASSLMSAAAFLFFALTATWIMDGRRGLVRHGGFAVALGLMLPAFLYGAHQLVPVEMVGILAGVGVALVGSLFAGRIPDTTRPDGARATRSQGSLFAPYLLLFTLVTGARMILPLWSALAHALVLETRTVRLSPLTSPGVMMALTALLLQAHRRVAVPLTPVLVRAARPVTAILAFLLLTQTMRATGLITVLAAAVTSLGPAARALVPLAGMVSGFITGSVAGGNALMMPLQAALGDAAGDPLRFAAMQNSAAGHAVFTAVPVLVLTLAIARDGGGAPVSLSRLLRFTLAVAALLVIVLTVFFMGLGALSPRGLTTASKQEIS
jgi:lactate permease